MNAKRKGTRNEHRSILLLESAGYACTRAAASLGVFDIVGVGPTNVVVVQCKTRDWPGAVEMEAIRNFQCPPLCKKIIHRWALRKETPRCPHGMRGARRNSFLPGCGLTRLPGGAHIESWREIFRQFGATGLATNPK